MAASVSNTNPERVVDYLAVAGEARGCGRASSLLAFIRLGGRGFVSGLVGFCCLTAAGFRVPKLCLLSPKCLCPSEARTEHGCPRFVVPVPLATDRSIHKFLNRNRDMVVGFREEFRADKQVGDG